MSMLIHARNSLFATLTRTYCLTQLAPAPTHSAPYPPTPDTPPLPQSPMPVPDTFAPARIHLVQINPAILFSVVPSLDRFPPPDESPTPLYTSPAPVACPPMHRRPQPILFSVVPSPARSPITSEVNTPRTSSVPFVRPKLIASNIVQRRPFSSSITQSLKDYQCLDMSPMPANIPYPYIPPMLFDRPSPLSGMIANTALVHR